MRSLKNLVVTVTLLLGLSGATWADSFLYSAPLFAKGFHTFNCSIRNVSNTNVEVVITIVDISGEIVTESNPTTISPGETSVRGAFGTWLESAPGTGGTGACEFRLLNSGKGQVRAAAFTMIPFDDDRTSIAAVEAR